MSMRMLPVRLLALLVSVMTAGPVESQEVTAVDIYLACRHHNARTNEEIRKVCQLRIPPPGAEFTQSHLDQWFPRQPSDEAARTRDSGRTFSDAVRDGQTTRIRVLGLLDSVASPELSSEYGEAALDSARRAAVVLLAGDLRGQMQPGDKLIVTGFADAPSSAAGGSAASDSHNEKIADLRARLVVQELIGSGIDSASIRLDATVVQSSIGAVRDVSRGVNIDLFVPASHVTRATHAFRERRREIAGLPPEPSTQAMPDLTSSAGGGFSPSWTTVASAGTDVLLDRASATLQVYVMDLVATRICPAGSGGIEWNQAERAWTRRESEQAAIRRQWMVDDALAHPEGVGSAVLEERRRRMLSFEQDRREFERARDRHERDLERRVGRSPQIAVLLSHTCGYFRGPFHVRQLRGAASLRTAIAADVRVMPERLLVEGLHARLAGGSGADPAFVDEAQAALFVVHMLRQLEQGADPLQVFAAMADDPVHAVEVHGKRFSLRGGDDARLTRSLLRLATFARHVSIAQDSIREFAGGDPIAADTLYTYALRALAVNHRRDSTAISRELGTLRLSVQALLDAHREVERAATRISEIAERLRTSDEVGSAGWEERRRGLQGQLVTAAVDIGAAALRMGPQEAQGQPSLVAPLRAMAVAARTGSNAQALSALTEVLGVLDARMQRADFRAPAWEQEAFSVLNLAVNVAEARSQAEMNDAFRSFVGQSRDFLTKREASRSWRLGVNAYVGAGGGGEWAERPTEGQENAWGGHLSLMVPVGVEFSRASDGGRSHGIFLSVIDLGAFASARLGTHEIETLPETELSRVFAPGLHYMVGLARVPFSVGMGITVAPGGREWSDPDGTRTRSGNAVRFSLFGGIDVPLFP